MLAAPWRALGTPGPGPGTVLEYTSAMARVCVACTIKHNACHNVMRVQVPCSASSTVCVHSIYHARGAIYTGTAGTADRGYSCGTPPTCACTLPVELSPTRALGSRSGQVVTFHVCVHPARASWPTATSDPYLVVYYLVVGARHVGRDRGLERRARARACSHEHTSLTI